MSRMQIEIDVVVDGGKIFLPPYSEIEKKALLAVSEAASRCVEPTLEQTCQTVKVLERSLFPECEKVTKKSNWERRSEKWRKYTIPARLLSKDEKASFASIRDVGWIFCIFQNTVGAKFSLGKLMTRLSIENGWKMTRDSNGHAYCYSREAYARLQEMITNNDKEIRVLDKYRISFSEN